MKKIFITMMVLVAISNSSFALMPNESYNAFYKLDNKVTFMGLIGYIDADQEQANYLEHVFKVTSTELKSATQKQNENAVANVLNYNFKNTKCILSEVQYKKYLEFINLYLNNDNNMKLVSENK